MGRIIMAGKKRASMGDVARLAGVSAQTVSRVVNGEPYVTDEKREAVLAAMRNLKYQPNAAARAMKRGDFKTIGVLYRSLHPVGNRKALEGIVDAAAAHSYSTLLIPMGSTQAAGGVGALSALEQSAIDVAIVIVSSSLSGAGRGAESSACAHCRAQFPRTQAGILGKHRRGIRYAGSGRTSARSRSPHRPSHRRARAIVARAATVKTRGVPRSSRPGARFPTSSAGTGAQNLATTPPARC